MDATMTVNSMAAKLSPDTSPTKLLQVAMPGDVANTLTSPRVESTSLSSKMKRMLASPKINKGKQTNLPNKTFGVPLDYLYERDKADVPVFVTRICDYLQVNGLHQEGLFRVNGNMKVVDRLKTAFDKCGDADLEDIGDVPAAASLLKMFLRELTEPVISEELHPSFINIQDRYGKDKDEAVPLIRELLKRMPTGNICLLKYLCKFMLFIASSSENNKMTPLALAIVFGPNLFRCGEGLDGLREQAYVNAVLLMMLQEYENIFQADDNIIKNIPEKPLAYLDHIKKEKDREKPSRPPPPQFSFDEEISSKEPSLETSPKRNLKKATSPRRSSKRKSPKNSPRHDTLEKKNAMKKNLAKEPARSSSPIYMQVSSPLSKQLVDNTINTTVREHLFGPGLVTSSTESFDEQNNELNKEKTEMAQIYPSVHDQVKRFSLKTEHSPNKTMKKTCSRSYSLPTPKCHIMDKDLDYVQEHSKDTLGRLTSSRPQPPKQRRRPSSKNKQSNEKGDLHSSQKQPFTVDTTQITTENEPSETTQNETTTSNRLQMLRASLTPLEKPKPVSPLQNTMESLSIKTYYSAEQLQDSMNYVPPLDLYRIKHEEQEVQRSPRGTSTMFDGPLRSPRSAPPSPSGTEKRHELWNEKRQDTVPIVEMSPLELRRRITALKKIILNFETHFEEHNARKPKPYEKEHIQKYIAELGRTKKQLKELISDYNGNADLLSQTAPIGPDLGTAPNLREIKPVTVDIIKEQTLANLRKKLQEKRLASARPQELKAMTFEQLSSEKLCVQKALLQYENLHGRPTTKEDKTLMRPLYDHYRKIKKCIAADKTDVEKDNAGHFDTTNTTKNKEICEIGRNEKNIRVPDTPSTISNVSPRKGYNEEENSYLGNEHGDTFSVTNRITDTPEPMSPNMGDSLRSIDEAVLHNATTGELLEQQRLTKRAKKRLGKLLKAYEEDFFHTWQRKVQKEDRLPKEAEYREYKLIKSKLRLVEALIAKKGSNQTV